MTLLVRYLTRTLLGSVALVMTVLIVLGTLFLFIGQQNDIGVGRYDTADALLFSVMNVPQFALQSLPVGTLIGAMLGIGLLARSHELTVMRAGGMGKWHLAGACLVSGVLLVVCALLVSEVVAPRLQQASTQMKAFAKFDKVSFAGGGGAWIRDGNFIINVERQTSARQYGEMLVFEVDDQQRLKSVGRAERASSGSEGDWQLAQYAESRFAGDTVDAVQSANYRLLSTVGADFLQLAATPPEELGLGELWRAVTYRRANGLESQEYEFSFWSKVARTSTLIVAVVFALPFGFGALRGAGVGARGVVGVVISIGYFLLQRMVESGTVVFSLDPLLLAWMPTAMLSVATLFLLVRAR